MDKQAILNGKKFTLGEGNEKTFSLKWENYWNNFGYRIIFHLWMETPGTSAIRIASFYIFSPDQKTGEKPCWSSPTPLVYICSKSSAEKLLLYLTPKERHDLEETLSIRYDISLCKAEKVFREGVRRNGGNGTAEMFAATQKQIQEIMHNPTDVASMILGNKDQLIVYLG